MGLLIPIRLRLLEAIFAISPTEEAQFNHSKSVANNNAGAIFDPIFLIAPKNKPLSSACLDIGEASEQEALSCVRRSFGASKMISSCL